jgi:hypothetical protein
MKAQKKTLFEFESEVFGYYKQSIVEQDKNVNKYGEKAGSVEKLMLKK